MWARTVEFMLACWLAISPFVFGHGEEQVFYWVNDLGSAFVVAVIALASFSRKLRGSHLLNLIPAAWLLVAGYFLTAPPSPPAAQNWIVIGLLLGMHAIIPSFAHEPCKSWLEYLESRS